MEGYRERQEGAQDWLLQEVMWPRMSTIYCSITFLLHTFFEKFLYICDMKNVPYIIAVILGLIFVTLGIINASVQAVCMGLTLTILFATIWVMDKYSRELEVSYGNLKEIASESLKAAEEALKASREANDSDMKHIRMIDGLNKVMEMLLKDCNFDTVDKLNAVLEEYNIMVQEDDDGELRLFVKK